MVFHAKYYHNGVCEKCLHSAVKKTCVNCNVLFMMHNAYHGKNTKCSHCYGEYMNYGISNGADKIKGITVSPEGFPHTINKIIIF